MEDQLKNGLLDYAIEAYQIGYLLLDANLTILRGNQQIGQWLSRSPEELANSEVTAALPELIGIEHILRGMSAGDEPFHIEEIHRPSTDGLGHYFDLQVVRLAGAEGCFLLTTADVTRKTRQELVLQQQRNEVQLLSAELTTANERLSYMLRRFLPTSVAEQMLSSRQMPKPGGEMLYEATILFADMRDFTVFAEAYQPSDTLDFLNTYLAVVADAILRHQGSLVQLVGDMVMGVFNVPDAQPDHPLRAVRAALDIQESLRVFNESADARYPTVAFGVGISTGAVIAGYLGVDRRFRYAVVGDATNVAFHLSSLAAPGHILLSETTVAEAGDALIVQEKGNFQLKRRRQSVKVYELGAIKPHLPIASPPTG